MRSRILYPPRKNPSARPRWTSAACYRSGRAARRGTCGTPRPGRRPRASACHCGCSSRPRPPASSLLLARSAQYSRTDVAGVAIAGNQGTGAGKGPPSRLPDLVPTRITCRPAPGDQSARAGSSWDSPRAPGSRGRVGGLPARQGLRVGDRGIERRAVRRRAVGRGAPAGPAPPSRPAPAPPTALPSPHRAERDDHACHTRRARVRVARLRQPQAPQVRPLGVRTRVRPSPRRRAPAAIRAGPSPSSGPRPPRRVPVRVLLVRAGRGTSRPPSPVGRVVRRQQRLRGGVQFIRGLLPGPRERQHEPGRRTQRNSGITTSGRLMSGRGSGSASSSPPPAQAGRQRRRLGRVRRDFRRPLEPSRPLRSSLPRMRFDFSSTVGGRRGPPAGFLSSSTQMKSSSSGGRSGTSIAGRSGSV